MIGWREAMEGALYGPEGFYRRESPERHFRTSVNASPQFAEAFAKLLADVDEALGRPAALDLVDMGAGDGTLLRGVLRALPPETAARVRPVAVELRPPAGADGLIWSSTPPESFRGLLVANEWLDNVPLDVVERTPDGPRLVLVDGRGREALGPEPGEADRAWLARWWPEGDRAEIGRARDEAWAGLVGRLEEGVAVAVDYAHGVETRRPSLAAYRDGMAVAPVPDGSCDVTAHVALDAAASAAEARCADDRAAEPALETVLTGQRAALHALGVTGERPARERALTDPLGYLRALSRAGEAAELTDPAGLGGFGWLMQAKGVSLRRFT